MQELYPWRTDDGIDTRFYIQNFYSVFFPTLDTDTAVRICCYDADGIMIARRAETLRARQTLEVSMRQWLGDMGREDERGTLMWHIALPEAIARNPIWAEKHAYFIDRGYFAFLKNGAQPTFVHGVDRYAVFQGNDTDRFDHYYPSGRTYVWVPEIPLGPILGCTKLDILTVNRTARRARIRVRVLDKDKAIRCHVEQDVEPRGIFLQPVAGRVLGELEDRGSLYVSGLPTQWTRVIAFRHFPTGAISAMHC